MIEIKEPLTHPASKAWYQLGLNKREPTKLYQIKPRKKRNNNGSGVFRLVGIGPGHSTSVIAKRCAIRVVTKERTIYEDFLPQLSLPTLQYYGSVHEPGDSHGWLFLEDAGEEGLQRTPAHLELASQWIGQMHVLASSLPICLQLPKHDPSFYYSFLEKGRRSLHQHLDNPVLSADDRELLHSISSYLMTVDRHWGEVEPFYDRMPKTFVHGDFVRKNICVRNSAMGICLFPFDWEYSGWGIPAVDLFWIDRVTYASTIHATWPDLDTTDLNRLVTIGTVFRCLLSIHWAGLGIGLSWNERVMRNLKIYFQELISACSKIGWCL